MASTSQYLKAEIRRRKIRRKRKTKAQRIAQRRLKELKVIRKRQRSLDRSIKKYR